MLMLRYFNFELRQLLRIQDIRSSSPDLNPDKIEMKTIKYYPDLYLK